MASNKKYWKSVEELNENSSIVEKLQKSEFIEDIPTSEFLGDKESLEASDTSRRDFLKYVGFSTAVASLAACEGPVVNSIPYVVKPDDVIPGIADYYASSIADGFDFANVLVKVREGRPIKIEPNRDSKNGTTNARVQASVLSLYTYTPPQKSIISKTFLLNTLHPFNSPSLSLSFIYLHFTIMKEPRREHYNHLLRHQELPLMPLDPALIGMHAM